jgi:toxin FitB
VRPETRVKLGSLLAQNSKLNGLTNADIEALPKGKRQINLLAAMTGVVAAFDSQVLAFDAEAALRYADMAVRARSLGKGFPTPDGYIAAIAVARGYCVATRDPSAFEAAGLQVIDPWA